MHLNVLGDEMELVPTLEIDGITEILVEWANPIAYSGTNSTVHILIDKPCVRRRDQALYALLYVSQISQYHTHTHTHIYIYIYIYIYAVCWILMG